MNKLKEKGSDKIRMRQNKAKGRIGQNLMLKEFRQEKAPVDKISEYRFKEAGVPSGLREEGNTNENEDPNPKRVFNHRTRTGRLKSIPDRSA